MKVLVLLVTLLGSALAADVQRKRGSDEYVTNTSKPAAGAAAGGSPQDGQGKYQQPAFVFQSKAHTYSPPQQLNYVVPQTYKYLPHANLAQISYVPQQQQQQQALQQAQHGAQYTTSQNALYDTQSAIKTVPAPQKLSYLQEQPQIHQQQQQQAHQPIQYSSAADVSSFKYQSPLVTYSNLGVIQQAIGKSGEQQQSSRQQFAHQTQQQPQQQPQQQQQSYTVQSQQPQFIYRTKFQIPQLTYNPQTQQVSNEKLQIYNQAPQTFQTQKQQSQVAYQPVAYQTVAPKQSASVPQQFVYSVPQQYSYTPTQYVPQESHTVPQPSYVIAPQYQVVPNYHQHPVQQ